ncbi:MAG: acetyl-CoA carboxylase biotin carboxylase subunit [Pseudomonadota bacterium]
MIKTLLIANRGEIACRVMLTAKRLGVRTVAVHSEFDARSRHVALADSAVAIGGAPATESYLNIERVIAAAKSNGADAIHPGYGFLSENAAFALACEEAGITFVGPSAQAIEAMGSKQGAKRIMESAGVPLIPGYHGDDQSDDGLAAAAAQIGYPVMVKASAGGGGKGMRRVDAPEDFEAALASAKREALTAFGDDRILLEKCLIDARHVEIQIFGDRHGNYVYLHERDCSLQRRHQKVIEEAPAPGFDAQRRAAMGAAAVAAARAVDYAGAGTVEFIVDDDGQFYFMEMNTRLQVEHPVTEMITGLDLVEWQLRIAAGDALPLQQNDIQLRGWSMEARLYAENPRKRFLPATGTLRRLRFPDAADDLRIETGVREGDTIGIYYDPMISKVVAWGPDRERAIARLSQALAATEISGLTTNLAFLQLLLDNEEFVAGNAHTQMIDRDLNEMLLKLPEVDPPLLALAATVECAARGQIQHIEADPAPFAALGAWRAFGAARTRLGLVAGGERYAAEIKQRGARFVVCLNGADADGPGHEVHLVDIDEDRATLSLGAETLTMRFARAPGTLDLFVAGQTFNLKVEGDYRLDRDAGSVAGGSLRAPMPGNIVSISVAVGDRVNAGDTLMVIEAMKMEHRISAPRAGVVKALPFAVGDAVDEQAQLVTLG